MVAFDQISQISVSDLHFDPQNPRLPTRLHHAPDSEVLEYMVRHGNVAELMGSIGATGYSQAEPLLVVKENDKFIVIEGNRRLAALKLLSNPQASLSKKSTIHDIATNSAHHPETVPVIIYSSREKVLDYLGYRHITGIKPWSSLAKARYVKQLYDQYYAAKSETVYGFIAEIIGSKGHFVKKSLLTLNAFQAIEDNDYFDIPGLNEETISYSVFSTALSYASLLSFIGIESSGDADVSNLDKKRLKELTSWMFKADAEGVTRLKDSRNLSMLAKVVDNPIAMTKFEEGMPLQEAVKYTGLPEEDFGILLNESYDKLKQANNIAYMLMNPKNTWPDMIKEINMLLKTLNETVVKKLVEQKDELSL